MIISVNEMNILENLIIHDIIILFPILIYEYFTLYRQCMKKEKNRIIFSFILFLSLYLSMFYKQYIPSEYEFICIILPFIIALINKRDIDSYIISLILIDYLITQTNYNIYLIIFFFISIFIIYLIYKRTDKDDSFLINFSSLIVGVIIIVNMILNKTTIINTILSILIYLINIKLITLLINEANSITNLHMNLKEFEKEKNIKINLFKITHEIKNPLAVVNGYLSMFDVENKEKSTKYINIIKAEIDRTLNLLNDFMEFTKIRIEKDYMNMSDLTLEVKDIIIPFFTSKNIEFKLECQDNLIINADYNRLKQVIINIIKNAAEACPENTGLVTTTVFKESNILYIYVKDNGMGMSKETMTRLQEPFYTTKEKGTGLGVSLSKEIIQSHGGNLSYSSILNKGTVCKITLPIN